MTVMQRVRGPARTTDLQAWEQLPGRDQVLERAGATATAVGHHVWIIGGRKGYGSTAWRPPSCTSWLWDLSHSHFYSTGSLIATIRNRRKHFYEDIMRYDTKMCRWDGGFGRVPFAGRAYHTAVPVGRKIWVIGGSDKIKAFSDVWVFDTDTLSWEEVKLQ